MSKYCVFHVLDNTLFQIRYRCCNCMRVLTVQQDGDHTESLYNHKYVCEKRKS